MCVASGFIDRSTVQLTGWVYCDVLQLSYWCEPPFVRTLKSSDGFVCEAVYQNSGSGYSTCHCIFGQQNNNKKGGVWCNLTSDNCAKLTLISLIYSQHTFIPSCMCCTQFSLERLYVQQKVECICSVLLLLLFC